MSRPAPAPVVIKVGGSLLDWPELPARLGEYLAGRATERLMLIAGGGRAADWIRELDAGYALGEERSHQLALHALDLTAHVLAALVANTVVVERFDELRAAWDDGRVTVLAPRLELEADDGQPGALPHRWDTTSDSIAARMAEVLGASELLLLKSADLPAGMTMTAAAERGLVDRMFPLVGSRLPRVFCRNLRDADGKDSALRA